MTVVLDTNALMMPVECDVRLFDELERLLGDVACVVPDAVITELTELSTGSGLEARAASVGLDLADRCEVVEAAAGYADHAVVELAETAAVTHVVTNDRALRRRLLDRDVSVISLRGKNKLAIIQP